MISSIVFSASHFNSDGYCLGMIRIKKGEDPMTASNWKKIDRPLFTGSPDRGIWSPGHNSFFMSPDGSERWLAYHAYTVPWSQTEGFGNARRQTFALPFTLDKDEIPIFGIPASVGSYHRAPSGEE